MTKRLAHAFEKASELPDDAQDLLAETLLEEIQWESQWDQTLARSQDVLDKLAEKAEQDYRSGKTRKWAFH